MFERNRSEYAELACSAGAMFVTIAPIVQNFKMRRFEGKLGIQNLASGSFTLCTLFCNQKHDLLKEPLPCKWHNDDSFPEDTYNVPNGIWTVLRYIICMRNKKAVGLRLKKRSIVEWFLYKTA